MMLFGEKYGDTVRVLDIGSSRELCGGTHVARTGDIGLFKVTGEGGVAAGIRRIEATTGKGALAWVQAQESMLSAARRGAQGAGRRDRIEDRAARRAGARGGEGARAAQGEGRLVARATTWPAARRTSGGVKVVAASIDGADVKSLRETVDKLKDKLKSAAIVLGSVVDGKVTLIAGVTGDLVVEGEGRRARQPRRHAGRRQGRRTAGHGAGRRHRPGRAAGRARFGARLGRATAVAASLRRRGAPRRVGIDDARLRSPQAADAQPQAHHGPSREAAGGDGGGSRAA